MKYSDFIEINEKFQTSINLEYDLNKIEKVRSFLANIIDLTNGHGGGPGHRGACRHILCDISEEYDCNLKQGLQCMVFRYHQDQ